MHKRQSFRMQLHAFVLARDIVAIEAITGDRRVEPLRVCRVHAKLVRTTGVRIESYARASVLSRQNMPFGVRGFAEHRIMYVPRSVIHVYPQRQRDVPMVSCNVSVHPGDVVLLYFTQ